MSCLGFAQDYFVLRGYVTDLDAQPLAGVFVRAANLDVGTTTDGEGKYELRLPEGLQRISFSFIGYKTQRMDIVIRNGITQNVRLLVDDNLLQAVEINNKKKDFSYEIIRKVIDKKPEYENQYITQKRHIYVKSVEKNTYAKKEEKTEEELAEEALKEPKDSTPKLNLFEGDFIQHIQHPKGFKQEKLAANKLGYQSSLFYTNTTDAEFDFNQNLIYVKKLGDNSYISPISNTALLAYKYKLLGSYFEGAQKVYKIKVTPRKMGNALFSGTIEVWDSLYALKSVNLEVTKNSLIQYTSFRLEQEYTFVQNKHVLNTAHYFWGIKTRKSKSEGKCTVHFSEYSFDSSYAKRFFNAEVGTTREDAYEKDTTFWAQLRPIPLTSEEYRFIQYKDSIHRMLNSKWYLDSIDSIYNQITVIKALWQGFGHINREKKQLWSFTPVANMINPVAIGGLRLQYSTSFYQKFENRKSVYVGPNIDYGIRNRDVKGGIYANHVYNPKKKSYFAGYLGKYFGFVNSFATLTDILNRSNFYEESSASLSHRTELFNGFYNSIGFNYAKREDLGDFQFNQDFDDIFENNTPQKFKTNVLFTVGLGISYTPKQLYIQEPKEKIILGSRFPTFSLNLRKGIPKVFNSSSTFTSIDFSISQKFNVGIIGQSVYNLNFGGFLDTSNLRIMDYRYQRGGDPYFLLPTMFGFQLIDSTFATFKPVLEGHYMHEFNGFLTSKIPGIKQLGIKTSFGGGMLYVPERKYSYSELIAGISRIFKIGKARYKLGFHYVVAQSNTKGFVSGFKVSLNPYNERTNTWSF